MAYFVTRAEWARVVKDRDGNKCVFCGGTQKLEAHHIKSRTEFPECALDIENGVTLCHRCHYTAHAGNYTIGGGAGCGGTAFNRGFSCTPRQMQRFISKYAETVRGYIPLAKIDKLTISGGILSVAVGAARRADDKNVLAFIHRAIEQPGAAFLRPLTTPQSLATP